MGGTILQIPCLLARSRMDAMYLMGSANSSNVGWKIGAMGTSMNSRFCKAWEFSNAWRNARCSAWLIVLCCSNCLGFLRCLFRRESIWGSVAAGRLVVLVVEDIYTAVRKKTAQGEEKWGKTKNNVSAYMVLHD